MEYTIIVLLVTLLGYGIYTRRYIKFLNSRIEQLLLAALKENVRAEKAERELKERSK